MYRMIGRFALASCLMVLGAAHAAELDVTFTIPVRVENIRSNWGKVAVFCAGTRPELSPAGYNFQQVGAVDVSNKARQSVSVTLTGTIKVPDDRTHWVCEFRVQPPGGSGFGWPPRSDVKAADGARGEF